MIPQVQQECFVGATQDGHKVVFEGLNYLLGQVATMIMGEDKLKLHLVALDGLLHVS